MAVTITAREARRALRSLIEQVNDDRAPIEITSKRGNAVAVRHTRYPKRYDDAQLSRVG
jgi:antitoxin YefM